MKRAATKALVVAMVSALVTVLPISANAVLIDADVTTTFDSGLEGWTEAGPTLSWSPSGGNPGGYARFVDNQTITGEIVAPSIYLGDWSHVSSIEFDHRLFSHGGIIVPYALEISGPAGSATLVGASAC